MAIAVACDGCGKEYRVDEKFAGKRTRCKQCGVELSIPVPFAPEPAEQDLESIFAAARGEPVQDPSTAVAIAPSPTVPIPVPPPLPAPAGYVAPTGYAPPAVHPAPAYTPPAAYTAPLIQPTRPRLQNASVGLDDLSPVLIFTFLALHVIGMIVQIVMVYRSQVPLEIRGSVIQLGIIVSVCYLIFYFATGATLTWLGVWTGSKIMGFAMPGAAYLRAAGLAAVPSVILAIGHLIQITTEFNFGLFTTVLAIPFILAAFYFATMRIFELDNAQGAVAAVFGFIGMVIGVIIAVLFTVLVVAEGMSSSIQRQLAAERGAPRATQPDYQRPADLPDPWRDMREQADARKAQEAAMVFQGVRDRIQRLHGQNAEHLTREAATQELESIRQALQRNQEHYPAQPWPELLSLLGRVEQEIATLPSTEPPEIIFTEMLAVSLWRPAETLLEELGEELSLGSAHEFRLMPPADMPLDLAASRDPRQAMAWRTAQPGGRLAVQLMPRANPRQYRPWVVSRPFQLRAAEQRDLLAIYAPNASVAVGDIGGLTFMRIAWQRPAEAGTPAGDAIRYVTALQEHWLLISIDLDQGHFIRPDLLESSARSLRRAGPDEPPVDPFTPERIAPRLVDDRRTALAILRGHGAAAEEVLIPYLSHADRAVAQAAMELIGEFGTARSAPALLELADSSDHQTATAARQLLRKIAPDQFDHVAEALLELRREGNVRRDSALQTLQRHPPDEQRHAEVARLLEEMIIDTDSIWVTEAAKALVVWADDQTVENLLPSIGDEEVPLSRRRDVLHVLVELKDERAVFPIIRWVVKEPRLVCESLRKMGPIAEDEVIKLLSQPDNSVRRSACEILEVIGTRKALRALPPIARDRRDPSLANAAQRAIDQINRRE